MGFFSSLFGNAPESGAPSRKGNATGHALTDSIGGRHDGISDYFSDSSFGYNPGDLTMLSLLPPIDRCLILERLFLEGHIRQGALPVWIDKLSMAYWKVKAQVSYGTAWWEFTAMEFLKSCQYGSKAGFLSEDERDYQEDKILGLMVRNVSKTYDQTLVYLPQHEMASPRLASLIRRLCADYAGREVFANVDLSTCKGFGDYVVFVNDRTDFFKEATGRAGGNALMPHYRAAKDKYMKAFPNNFPPWWFGELADYEKRIEEGRPFTEEEAASEMPEILRSKSPYWLMV